MEISFENSLGVKFFDLCERNWLARREASRNVPNFTWSENDTSTVRPETGWTPSYVDLLSLSTLLLRKRCFTFTVQGKPITKFLSVITRKSFCRYETIVASCYYRTGIPSWNPLKTVYSVFEYLPTNWRKASLIGSIILISVIPNNHLSVDLTAEVK